MSARLLAFFLVVAAACNDTAAAEDQMCPAAQVPLCAKTDSTVAVILPMTNDAVVRSAAALLNPSVKEVLTTEMIAVKDAIAAGNVTLARHAISRARSSIASARQQNSHPGDAPDLSAIELALLQLDRATK